MSEIVRFGIKIYFLSESKMYVIEEGAWQSEKCKKSHILFELSLIEFRSCFTFTTLNIASNIPRAEPFFPFLSQKNIFIGLPLGLPLKPN